MGEARCLEGEAGGGSARVRQGHWRGLLLSAVIGMLLLAPGDSGRKVSCASASACVAVGASASGAAQTWLIVEAGGNLVMMESPPPVPASTESALNGVSCGATACTAVGVYKESGVYKPLVDRWNGSSWSRQEAPSPASSSANAMLGVSCPTTTTCVAVGEAGAKPVVETWNGYPTSGSQRPVVVRYE
jgi:hypothetical protein